MPRRANETDSVRVEIRASEEVAGYLDELARLGIHGKNRSEVARMLVAVGVEGLIKEGFLQLKRP